MEQYLLHDKKGYYWIWFRNESGKPELNGPHPIPMINLKPIETDNPLSFDPKVRASNDCSRRKRERLFGFLDEL